MRRTKISSLLPMGVALAMGSLAGAAAPAADTSGSRLELPPHYRLAWADEFERDGLPDPSKWTHETTLNKRGWHNHELQYYSGPRGRNAVVKEGRLIITARQESMSGARDWGGQRYTSARLITRGKAEWTYGFFVVRAKLPCAKGTWAAIWTLGSRGTWPAGGELDIMEHVGKEPGRVFSTVHTTAGHGGNGSGAATQVPDACNAFHDYQMHWTADSVRFGIDGVVHYEYRNPHDGRARWPFGARQYLLLNIAMGGDLGGQVDDAALPDSMEIEHVRVYQPAR